MNVILCGYHWAGCMALEMLLQNGHHVFVYTHPATEAVPALDELAEKRGVKYSLADISKIDLPFIPDIICSIYYKHIIKQHIIDACGGKIFNLHPSLLPRYRGCSSITWAIINGEKECGYTYHYIDKNIDTGNIILQKKIDIKDFDTQLSLYYRMMFLAIEELDNVIKLVMDGYPGYEQRGVVTFNNRGCPNLGRIDDSWPDEKIERFIRAMIFPPLPYASYYKTAVCSYRQFERLKAANHVTYFSRNMHEFNERSVALIHHLMRRFRNLPIMRKTERLWQPIWRLLKNIKNQKKAELTKIEHASKFYIEHVNNLCPELNAAGADSAFIAPSCNIPIVTSIAPKRIEYQKKAISTWLAQGFTPISVNYDDEIENLKPFFPEVQFLSVQTDSYPLLGKKRVFINELLFHANTWAQQNNCRIAGIINADVPLYNINIELLKHHAESSLVFSRRVDVETYEQTFGVPYNNGFDAFFFSYELLHDFPPCTFALGEPWWDIAVPLWIIMRNRPISACFPPICFHVMHEINWSAASWISMGRTAYNIFEPLPMPSLSPYSPFPDRLLFAKTNLPPAVLIEEFCKFSTKIVNSVPNEVDFMRFVR